MAITKGREAGANHSHRKMNLSYKQAIVKS
jgi:hypothetical protein